MHATGKCDGFSSVHPFTSEIFELMEKRLYANADGSTFVTVVRKPADRPAVTASLNSDLARI